MKRFFSLLAVICLLFLSGCGKNNGEPVEEKKIGQTETAIGKEPTVTDGGTVKVTVRKPDTFNPLITQFESCRELYYLFYDGLFTLTASFSAAGNLAESYTPYEDCMGGVLKLKSGISFSDGSLLTADDVVYTINFIKEHPVLYGGCVLNIESATSEGNDTVNIKLYEAKRHFESMLTFPIIKQNSPEEMTYPVGTGQFYCDEGDVGYTELICRRNNNYHMGRPYLDGFSVRFTNSDLKAEAAFGTGETDLMLNYAQGNYSSGKVTVYKGNTNRFEFLGFNTRYPLFALTETRRAVYEAVGRMKLSDSAERIENAALIPVNPNAWFFEQEATESEREEPREILERNFWKMGTSGAYEKDNLSFSFKITVNADDSERTALAEFISGELIKYGISADVTALPYDEYAEAIATGNFEAFIGGAAIGNASDIGFLFKTGGESNVFGYSGGVMDLRIDALANASDSELAAEEKKFNKVFADTAPAVGLYFKNVYVAVRKNIVVASLSPTSVYANAYTWYMTK